ncbi:N-acetylglucosamine-1-phosphodiester alpha-N-acetylglucosaminidase [Elgaria multicarinata webbii]|uniref:N-acetylglucosamine-1-phosphodiester alpha-N-acetylglucosaminidase n=1 Tax=Elgaria multicarinata webbii TaxID=159646 RepID=UPI002FCCBB5F
MAASMERLVHVLGKRRRPAAVLAAFFLVLLRCFLGVQSRAAVWDSLNDDLLLPYPPPRHGPLHRHRSARDCRALLGGNATHESWPGDNSSVPLLAVTRSFVSYIPPKGPNRRQVYGHLTIARDPLRTFSVLEPGGPGGCRSRSRWTVEEAARRGECLVAQNGGYFDMDTGKCFGNIVSDGQLAQTSGGVQNAQFGIRKDGTLVFGYLSEEEVLAKENPFVQLVSGVGWLLRDGEVYVNQSRAVECDEVQETGSFDRFINVVSARTAVGHDRQGQLVLAHFDGQTDTRGLSLWEVAEFLKEQGVVNAINMDGGGSATLVLNGTLASYPSDHCAFDSRWRCPRRISTVLCVHEPVCQPPGCSGHGRCVLGQCQCDGAFWSGAACGVLDCGPSNCTLHGMCTETGCLCDAGWMGTNCSEVCPGGSYGDGCTQKCLCRHGGTCNSVNGSCVCPAGFQGVLCEEAGRKADEKEEPLFTVKALMVILLLSVLLFFSIAVNVTLFYCCLRQRGRGQHTYRPLKAMNGDSTQSCPSAKEDYMEEEQEDWDTNPTERDTFL